MKERSRKSRQPKYRCLISQTTVTTRKPFRRRLHLHDLTDREIGQGLKTGELIGLFEEIPAEDEDTQQEQ
ncbi:hypothetical protein [Fulvitalea axinellae]|uniref:hypothetical protein n=1 Tax=Fulvitalea axinellae TaxID=1182444 RepID=UPI0030CA5AC0